MNTKTIIYRGLVTLIAVLLLTACVSPVLAQITNKPGAHHGEMDYPINWKQYYTLDEYIKMMHEMQKQYSDLADIESIGTSRMGRTQYMMTITNKATGDHSTKTALWMDGAIHGNEVNGITCSMYTIWSLLTRYKYDEYIKNLVDTYTFYILPTHNIDANDSFLSYPNNPNNPREPYRPEDNDGDGLYDEDQTEDVDGDGELSTMYIEDPKGTYKLSADKRRFIQIDSPNEDVLRFRRIGSEGYDNDGDGRFNEDDIGGPDPNRNFPYDWNLSAGWPYPLSENHTRNVYEAQLARPNIFATIHYHNTGRLIMMAAPPARPQTEQQAAQAAQRGGRGGQQQAPPPVTNIYRPDIQRNVEPDYLTDWNTQLNIATEGARILKNYRATTAGGNGQQTAAPYFMLGAFSYLIELWGSPTPEIDIDGDGRANDEEYIIWVDTEFNGQGWINPHKVQHPDLGEIWIGGTRTKHMVRTPAGKYIESEALKNSKFALYLASQFPKVEVGDITVIPATDKLYWVDVTVKNDKIYPTASVRAEKLNIAEMDILTFNSSSNVKMITVPSGNVTIDPLDRTTSGRVAATKETSLRLTGKDSQRFRYLVEMDGSSGWVEFNIKSKFGGEDTKRINLRIGN
ncbi:M14 family metallopeptidase [candidate division KSB1 bacterium]